MKIGVRFEEELVVVGEVAALLIDARVKPRKGEGASQGKGCKSLWKCTVLLGGCTFPRAVQGCELGRIVAPDIRRPVTSGSVTLVSNSMFQRK